MTPRGRAWALSMGALVAALAATPVVAETVAIRAGAVLADAAGDPTGPATIVVTDGRIVSITPGHGAVTAPHRRSGRRFLEGGDRA